MKLLRGTLSALAVAGAAALLRKKDGLHSLADLERDLIDLDATPDP